MTVGPEDFFKRIEESGLLNDSIVEQKDRLRAAGSGEDAAADLVSQKLLTAYQSEVLLSGEDVPLVLGDYVVTESIGRGGMGYVLKARHRRMKRTVAIKFLLKSLTDSDDLRRRFEREVEAAAQLDHQNIVTAYDAGVHEGSHYLVMQYVDGEDLSQIVKSSGPMDIPDAVDVIRQAALGLGYAHDRGIIHRDIKPGNLLLDSEGVVRILDMGLARMTPSPGDELEGGAHADLTNTGSVMGTIDYMAPEQALDAKSVDHRADLYALGCTLYFLLTSNPPFRNETVMRRLLAHREQPAPRISEYRPGAPPELDEIFATMMAKSPDDRYPSMKHLVAALDSLGLNDSEAEQMATLDVPDDGNGGFVKLPDVSDPSISESQTSPGMSLQSEDEPSTGATRSVPVSDVTILETPSNVSALNTLDNAEPVPLAGTSDTDFTGIGETIIGDSQSIAGAAAERAAKSPPPWKLIAPAGLAVVALIAFLVTRPEPAAEDEEPSNSAAVATAPQNDTPSGDPQTPESSETQSPDRRGAEWVLSLGGSISIDTPDGTRLDIEELKDLPHGAFVVKKVSIQNRPQVTDDGLANLRGCSQLAAIYAYDTAITDQGLANLTDEGRQPLENLTSLFIARTKVSDTGLRYLADSKDLLYLDIQSNPISDGSLLGDFRQLSTLDIVRTKISAEDLSILQGLPLLRKLSVDGRQLEGIGSQHVSSLNKLSELTVQYPRPGFDGAVLRKLEELTRLELLELSDGQLSDVLWSAVGSVPKLETLNLDGDGVTEAAIGKMPALPELKVLTLKNGEENVSGETIAAAVRRAPSLKELVVSHNELNDGDAKSLESLTQLTRLTCTDNDITAGCVRSLHKALPNCRIVSDYGTFQQTVAVMNPDRRAAEVVLGLGGAVWVGSDFQQIVDPAELPIEKFEVTKIDLSEKKNIEDEFLANFRGLGDLEILILTETSTTDRGLANLTDEGRQPLPALERLYLDGTKISQTGLQFLSGSRGLFTLMLDGTAITEGAVLNQFPKLRSLELGQTSLTTAKLLEIIARCPQLDRLTMDGRHLTETMASSLAALPELAGLKLRDLPSDFEPGRLAKFSLLSELYVNSDDSTVFDDDFWKVVAGLEKLHILMCKGVTDESLAKARPTSQVEVLIVMSRVVTGAAVANSMSKFPNVASLTVNYSDWTDNDVQQLHGLKSLGKLDLTKNSASVEAIKALSAALPKCQIISDHGTFGGGAVAGRRSVLSFDGVDDFVECPGVTIASNRPFAIEATVTNWKEGYGTVCGWMGNVGLYLAKGNLIGAGITTTELQDGQTHKLGTEIPDTDVLRLALTSDGKQIRLFVNGVERTSRTNDHPIRSMEQVKGRFFCIGAYDFVRESRLLGPFSGVIDEVRISSTQRYADQYVPPERLAADEHTVALYHFDEGQGTVLKDSSGNGHHGIIHGATWVKIAAGSSEQASVQQVREAVEWVLSNGGWCALKRPHEADRRWTVTSLEKIPSEPFIVHAIAVDVRREDDSKLLFEPLQQLQGLREFHTNSAVTPEDVAWLQNSPELEVLHVHSTSRLNDDWAARLQHFSKLRRLTWGHFGDAGLAHLSRISSLEEISLHVPATAAGIRQLSSLPNLRSVDLQFGQVTPDLAAAVGTLPAVRKLIISWRERNIEPGAWKEIEKLTQLEALWLMSLNLDDNVIPHLQKLTNLRDLKIQNNRFSRQGVEQLRKSLPLADIESDYGVFESAAVINRRAAEWLLKNNGSGVVKRFDSGRQTGVKSGEQLPEWPFELIQINLNSGSRFSENEFVKLRGLTSLEGAFLTYFPLSDAALANLQDSSGLRSLHIEGTHITDEGLAVLAHFPQLTGLRLSHGFSETGLTRILEKKGLKYLGIGFKSERVNGLSRLSELTELYELSLNHADLSFDGNGPFSLDAVRKLAGLKTLHLGVCRIDSRCLQELASISHLTTLVLRKCEYEGDALNELSRFEHLEKLQLPQSELTDAIVPTVSRLTNLKSLNITQNKLTPNGIATLRKSLRGCRIESDHGTFEPTQLPRLLALQFNDSDDVVEIPLAYDGSYPITIEAWVRPTEFGTHTNVIGNRDGLDKGLTLKIDTRSGNNRWAFLGNQMNDALYVSSDGRVSDVDGSRVRLNEWTHLAGSWDGQRTQLFINGKVYRDMFVGDKKVAADAHVKLIPSDAKFIISGSMNPFRGQIRSVRISETIRYLDDFTPVSNLNADDKTLLLYSFEESTGKTLKDTSGNGHHGTIRGATWVRDNDDDLSQADTMQSRRAVEWIVSNGGSCVIRLNSQEQDLAITKPEAIPDGPFRLIEITLSKDGIPEEEFDRLSGLTSLETVSLIDCPVTDTALANLRDSRDLMSLSLGNTQVTDDGLAILDNFPRLKVLNMPSGITDRGFVHVLKCQRLEQLGGTFRSVRGPILNRLPELDQLQTLYIYGVDASSMATDASRLEVFHQLPKLTVLHLFRSKLPRSLVKGLGQARQIRTLSLFHCEIESGGLADLERLQHLENLSLAGSGLSDEHVDVLSKLTGLDALGVSDNDFTPDGISRLRKALPGCKIVSDHGTFEPTSK